MSVTQTSVNVLFAIANVLLGTNGRAPTLPSKKPTKSTKSTKPDKSGKPDKPNAAESSSEKELKEIRDILKKGIDVSIASPDLVKSFNGINRAQNEFVAGIVEGMQTEMNNISSGLNEQGEPDGYDMTPEQRKNLVDSMFESFSKMMKEQGNGSDLFSAAKESNGLEDIEVEKEKAEVEAKHHQELIDALSACCAIDKNESKDEKQKGMFGGFLGDKEGGVFGTGIMGFLAGLLGIAGVSTILPKILGGMGAAASFLGKLVPFLGASIAAISGIMDLMEGKAQTEIPKGLMMLSPFHWGAYIGDKFNQLYEAISKYFGGTGSLGSDIYDALEGTREKYDDLKEHFKSKVDEWIGDVDKFFSSEGWPAKKFEELKQYVSDRGNDIMESIKTFFSSEGLPARKFDEGVEWSKEKFEEAKASIQKFFDDGLISIKEQIDAFKQRYNDTVDFLGKTLEDLKQKPGEWIQDAKEGIKEFASQMVSAKEDPIDSNIVDTNRATIEQELAKARSDNKILEDQREMSDFDKKMYKEDSDKIKKLERELEQQNAIDAELKTLREKKDFGTGRGAVEKRKQNEERQAELLRQSQQLRKSPVALRPVPGSPEDLKALEPVATSEKLAPTRGSIERQKEDISSTDVVEESIIEAPISSEPVAEKRTQGRGSRVRAKESAASTVDYILKSSSSEPKAYSVAVPLIDSSQIKVKPEFDLSSIQQPTATSQISQKNPLEQKDSLQYGIVEETALDISDKESKKATDLISGITSIQQSSTSANSVTSINISPTTNIGSSMAPAYPNRGLSSSLSTN